MNVEPHTRMLSLFVQADGARLEMAVSPLSIAVIAKKVRQAQVSLPSFFFFILVEIVVSFSCHWNSQSRKKAICYWNISTSNLYSIEYSHENSLQLHFTQMELSCDYLQAGIKRVQYKLNKICLYSLKSTVFLWTLHPPLIQQIRTKYCRPQVYSGIHQVLQQTL